MGRHGPTRTQLGDRTHGHRNLCAAGPSLGLKALEDPEGRAESQGWESISEYVVMELGHDKWVDCQWEKDSSSSSNKGT